MKRRLPIVQNNPSAPAGGGEDTPPPPWHWVPLGAFVSLLAGAALARLLYVPFMQRQIERVYGRPSSPAEFARIHERLPASTRHALQLQLSLAGLAVAMVAVFLGGFVVGRFGARTNPRHATLAGASALTLMVLFIGRGLTALQLVAYLVVIPLGGLVSYLGGRAGTALRERAAQGK
jgi:hypothetical protein